MQRVRYQAGFAADGTRHVCAVEARAPVESTLSQRV